jgi:hypothetical protein
MIKKIQEAKIQDFMALESWCIWKATSEKEQWKEAMGYKNQGT